MATLFFTSNPSIQATAIVGGPFERNGPLAPTFDWCSDDLWCGQQSYEKAHRYYIEEASRLLLAKAQLQLRDVSAFVGGDLINQMTPTSFAARSLQIPYLGVFGACSTSMASLIVSASFVNQGLERVVTGAFSHNAAVEKQFRYPTEYGGQKPPTAQWTMTGGGVALVEKGGAIVIAAGTIGKVVDYGITDPFNMGAAMAPAAASTFIQHMTALGENGAEYDAIMTGDLGRIGSVLFNQLVEERGYQIATRSMDGGVLLYDEQQPVLAGGSGAGCSAAVAYGYVYERLRTKQWRRVLVIATGALLSPLSYQQGDSIPCIAHAVTLEVRDDD